MSGRGFECSFSLASFFNVDVVIPCPQVKGSEKLGFSQLAGQVFKVRKGIAVWDSVLVKDAVVLHRSKQAIFF